MIIISFKHKIIVHSILRNPCIGWNYIFDIMRQIEESEKANSCQELTPGLSNRQPVGGAGGDCLVAIAQWSEYWHFVLGFDSWQLLAPYFPLLLPHNIENVLLHKYIMYDLCDKFMCIFTATATIFCAFLMVALHRCFHFPNHVLCYRLDSHLF